MSTVAIGTGAVLGLGGLPMMLVLLAGAVVVGAISSGANSGAVREQTAEERKHDLLHIHGKITQEMTALVNGVSDIDERKKLLSQLDSISDSLRADIENYRAVSPDAAFREIRQKVISVRMDEEMALSFYDEFQKIESALNGKIPSGFTAEWNDIQRELLETNKLALQSKIKSLTALLNRTRAFAGKAAHAANISLTGLAEEKHTIQMPPRKLTPFVSDIMYFGVRVAYFDPDEARRLRPLIEEATADETDIFRLTAIRQEVKMRYGKLKEQKTLTETFREELRGLLPLARRACGAEALIVRMEELLTANDIPRGKFMPLHESVKILLTEQFESITDGIAAEKISGVLSEMGYSLIDDDGKGISAGEVSFMESPYEGYQVQVKAGKGGALSTRLVRVAGSEDEKNFPSEYQRQKDIEVGGKWCKDLETFHEKMKFNGIEFKTTFRKEPEDDPLDVIVRTGAARGKKRRKSSEITRAVQAKEYSE